jgi:hypothetical protein
VVKEAKINAWIMHGADNLLNFRRSPFHETLRSASRDHYANLFENHADDLLASVERLLRDAKVREPRPVSMSNSRALEGCWELKTHDDPKTITINGFPDYAYRFVPIVLSADLMGEREVVRHLCHNRACVCPDHLVIGTYQQNTQDEHERIYAGRDSKGRGQKI